MGGFILDISINSNLKEYKDKWHNCDFSRKNWKFPVGTYDFTKKKNPDASAHHVIKNKNQGFGWDTTSFSKMFGKNFASKNDILISDCL